MSIYSGYECFVSVLETLKEGEVIELRIRDCSKYRFKRVKARVAKNRSLLPEGEDLWIRDMIGRLLFNTPWTIKVVEEMGDN